MKLQNPVAANFWETLFEKPAKSVMYKSHIRPVLAAKKPRFKRVEIGPHITEAQKQAISELPPKMTKRCKALMKQIICFSRQKGSL